jgi:hypothetical protein
LTALMQETVETSGKLYHMITQMAFTD